MTTPSEKTMQIGNYTGVVAPSYQYPLLLDGLSRIADVLAAPETKVISEGRHRNSIVRLPSSSGDALTIVVKSFGRQPLWKDKADSVRGSKALRTWTAATALRDRGVGTPEPVAYLERWEVGRLQESYFLTVYEPGITTFKDEMIRLFREDPECEKFMSLLHYVADAVRGMHQGGIQHNDLGNQNVLLRYRGGTEWGDIQFADLNRSRIKDTLSLRERARDISRIYLPSDFLRVFMPMYFDDSVPPALFLKWEDLYRKRYALHCATRTLRHPFRSRRIGRKDGEPEYPSERDMWVWDERSAQAIAVLRSRDRGRLSRLRNVVGTAGSALRALPAVWGEYKSLLAQCYTAEVELADRVGVAVHPDPKTLDRRLRFVEKLGRVPLLIRFCRHEGRQQWDFTSHVVRDLHAAGHAVSVALVQDRDAVREPKQWEEFISFVLERVTPHVQRVEVGHAVNRTKWGIWSWAEHRRMLECMARIAAKYPEARLMGPAVIDFEYPHVLAALENVPEEMHFDALSHHLYVDRRGAPERKQGRFSSLEKFALARAIARRSDRCEDRLIVSEVNWPLKGTGVYSPVNSPYETPEPRFNDPSVGETEYAAFMVRYLLIALCSGMVEQVYWWRLVARGFGLVDDTDSAAWRERPAYRALAHMLSAIGRSRFVGKTIRDGFHVFRFTSSEEAETCVLYGEDRELEYEVPFSFSRATDMMGNELGRAGNSLRIGGAPVFLYDTARAGENNPSAPKDALRASS